MCIQNWIMSFKMRLLTTQKIKQINIFEKIEGRKGKKEKFP